MSPEPATHSEAAACPYSGSLAASISLGAGSGRRVPRIKSLPLIGPLRQFTGDVVHFLNRSRAQYGDQFRLRILGFEMTVLSGRDAVALLDSDVLLSTTDSMAVLMKAVNSRLPGTFDGPQHKSFRKLHSGFLNRGLERQRRDEVFACVSRHVETWQVGHRFNPLHEAQSQTVDILSNVLNGEPFPFSSRDLSTVVHTLIMATYGRVPLWLALNNPIYRAAQKRMNAHALDLVARVRKDPELQANTLVGQYLHHPPPEGMDHWDDDDLKIVPLAAYLAGYDTVASAATSMLYQLLSNPRCLARVRDEYRQLAMSADGHVDPMQQKYLRAAFLETTRINPPGAIVMRTATQDFQYKGYTLRQGDRVLIQISSEHMNADLFPQPEHFDPTRFLGENASELKRAVLTFGAGEHRCTGAAIGPLFCQEMVSYWVNHFDLQLVPGRDKPKIVAMPFTQPMGLEVRVLGRRDPFAAA